LNLREADGSCLTEKKQRKFVSDGKMLAVTEEKLAGSVVFIVVVKNRRQ
jgi:hypothetical protein